MEVGSLKESNEKLLADLTDIQQKLASATEEWTAEKQQWSNKVSLPIIVGYTITLSYT